jgi:hypothetical protein
MKVVELHLDEETYQRAHDLATFRHLTLEELFAVALERLEMLTESQALLIGMFSEEPELLDLVVEDAMQSRESHRLR